MSINPRLGIIGGLGLGASGRLYRLIVESIMAKSPGHYPDIVLHSVPISKDLESRFIQGEISELDVAAIRDLLYRSAQTLARSRVDVVALACNTLHAYLPMIRQAADRPILDMEKATRRALSHSPYRCIAVLATEGSRRLGIYSGSDTPGRRLIFPNHHWQPTVTHCIQRLLADPDDHSVASELADSVRDFAPDADAIILGCTELSMVSDHPAFHLPLIDSLRELADECAAALLQPARTPSRPRAYGRRLEPGDMLRDVNGVPEVAALTASTRSEPGTESFGGEIELLVVDSQLILTPVPRNVVDAIQSAIGEACYRDGWLDFYRESPRLGYDTAYHLLELNLGVYGSLAEIVEATWRSVEIINRVLRQHSLSLLTLAHHPTVSDAVAFRDASTRLRYLDAGGKEGMGGQANTELSPAQILRLERAYGPDGYRHGRGVNRSRVSRSMAVHAWNGLEISQAIRNIAVIQATSWLTNLITANSPFEEGELTSRDSRLDVWEGFLRPSIIDSDHSLHEPARIGALSLASYYRHLLSRIPFCFSDPDDPTQTVLPVREEHQSSTFELLLRGHCRVIDHTGREKSMAVTLGDLLAVDGWNFSNSRLRLRHPDHRQIDPDGALGREFARAIHRDDGTAAETILEHAFGSGGPASVRLCLEGRTNATALPGLHSNFLPAESSLQQYRLKPDRISAPRSYIDERYFGPKQSVSADDSGWDALVAPFVLQTALIRSTRSVLSLLEGTDLSWWSLNHDLPAAANRVGDDFGFNATVTNLRGRKVHLGSLARQVWGVARSSLTWDEHARLGRVIAYIDAVVALEMAPSERFLRMIALRSGAVGRDTFGFAADFYRHIGGYSFGDHLDHSDLIMPADAVAPHVLISEHHELPQELVGIRVGDAATLTQRPAAWPLTDESVPSQ